MDMGRNRDTIGQRRTGTQTEETGTQTDRDTDRQGHRWTRAGTQGQGKRHKQTQIDMDRDTDGYTTLMENLQKKSVESIKFYRILQNRILFTDALNKLKNKCSPVN
jgi:hypothetical protein